MKVIAVIPAYNEGTHIAVVVGEVQKHVDQVIVVDDGSTDNTAERACEAGATVLSHPLNCGPGAATMTGIVASRRLGAQCIVTIDADGQHRAEDIRKILQPIQEGRADVVIGTRFRGPKNTIPPIRKIFNSLGNIFTFITTGMYVSDSQSGFKAFGSVAVQSLQLHMSGFEFCSEIIREIQMHHWRVVEVPIKVTYSEYTLAKGQSFSSGVVTACRMLLRSFLR